jgi:uncharacterized membrane protein (UPF0182 family)
VYQRPARTIIYYAIAIAALIAVIAVFTSTVGIYTDWLWFASMGQLRVYQTRLLTQAGMWLGGALVALLVLALNWFLIPRPLLNQLRLQLQDSRRATIVVGARILTIALGMVAALVILEMAGVVKNHWMTFLVFANSTPFGVSDPIFNLDVGFYVFELPMYRFFVGWLLALVVIALIGSALVYLSAQRIRARMATTHLSVLGALFLAGKAVDYQLQRFALLDSSRGAVFGAGYTDVHARLPILNLLSIVVALGAIVLLVNIFARRWRLLLAVGAIWIALSFIGSLYPGLVQRFIVQPDELARERPYIENNIRFTRYAYGLSGVQESDYPVTGELTAEELENNAETISNVRLWDWRPLQATYEQLQEIRTYYTFIDLDADRYTVGGHLRQFTLGVRELDVEQLNEDARTWINQHLIYTHGYGLCLSPVSEASTEGLPLFLVRDIPPQSSDPVLAITRPEIYFGEKTGNYVIVNTSEDEFDYPSGDQNIYTRYEGGDGVRLGGGLRRLALALRFSSTPILLSRAIGSDSRILFHRTIYDRVSTLAPMLWYDADPYPVIADGRIVWIYDAFTWSDRFPYSQLARGLNYIRNSVKVAIDAYTGETTFYVVDPSDPVIQVYQAIFPDLFTPGEEAPQALRDHWRYPDQLFTIQSDIYAAYHMLDPRVFYNREDLWQTPLEGDEEMPPYYVVMRLPNEEAVEFMSIRPYVPAGKDNMIAWLYADSDGADYGQLGVYKFSKEVLVYGPRQIGGRINQDPYISSQLSLWGQRGSSVILGNLLVIPIDGTLIYIQPLYLQAESTQLPELKRVLVAYGNRVVMAETLDAALTQVLSGEAVTAPPEEIPSGPLSGDVAELARSAQAHYEAAQACLQQGDWTCYGTELAALEAALEALVAATGE